MVIKIKSTFTDSNIEVAQSFSHGFFGKKLDQRTSHSCGFVERSSTNAFNVIYSSDNLNITIGEQSVECHELSEYLETLNITSVLLDSTSLDIPELALLFSAISSVGIKELIIIYIEPDDYTSKENDQPVHEDFDLSEDIIGFEASGIPTISQPYSDVEEKLFVFFLGFEENRLLGAFETFDISSEATKIIFGVPAFKSGWETRSFKKNIRVLKDNTLFGRIGYCSANNPSSAINQLRLFNSYDSKPLYILPIGTKPNSIGVLLYLIENKNSRLLYDQPRKKSSRSYGVGRQHLYKVSF